MTHLNRSVLTMTSNTDKPNIPLPLSKRLNLTHKKNDTATSNKNNFSLRRNIGTGSIKDLILFYEITYGKGEQSSASFKPNSIKTQTKNKSDNEKLTQIPLNNTNKENETNSDASNFSSTNSSIVSSLASSMASLSNIDKTHTLKSEAESAKGHCFNIDSISQNKNSEIIMSSTKETQENKTQYKHIISTEIFSRPSFINNKRLNLSSKSSIINFPSQKQKEEEQEELQLPIGISNNKRENYVSKLLIDNRGGEEKQTEERIFLVELSEGMLKNFFFTNRCFALKLK